MDAAADQPREADPGHQPTRRFQWLRGNEGWSGAEDGARMLGAVAVALLVIAFKLLVNAGAGSNFGYLSGVSGVIIASWIAGAAGGLVATLIGAVAEVALFNNIPGGTMPDSLLADLRLVLFLFNGVVLAIITGRLRQTAAREQAARRDREVQLAAQREAWAAAERDSVRLARLQAVTASLTGTMTPEDVAAAVLDRGIMALGAVAGAVFRVDAPDQALTVLASRGYPAARVSLQAGYTPQPRSHIRHALAEGRALFLSDPVAWAEEYPDTPPAPLPDAPTGGALAVMPLNSGRRRVGLAIFRFADRPHFSDGTADLAMRLADQGAIALDRALAHREEQRSFVALEQAQARLTFVASVSELIGSSADVAAGLSALTRAAVPALADWCAVGLTDGDRRIRTTAGSSEPVERTVSQLAEQVPEDLGLALAGDDVRAGAQFVALDETWRQRHGDAPVVSAVARLGTASALIAPIMTPSGERLGSLVLGSAAPSRYGVDDLAMARHVADRISVATERARLFGAVTRFKATVDASADAVYVFDPGTLRVTYVNRGGADLVGLAVPKVEGQPITRLLASSDEEGFRRRLANLHASSRGVLTYTDVVAHSGGRRIPVDVLLQDVVLPDGSRTAILTARDTSDRIDVQNRLAKIAEDERRQAAELRAVIQAVGDGILVVGPDGRVSLANDAALGMLSGTVPEQLADLEVHLGVEPGRLSTRSEAGDHAMAAPEPVSVHLDDGRWLEVSTYPADLAGAPLGRARLAQIVVIRDVTRAREAAAAQEAFLGVLSHELRTPITTIYGYAKVLQRPSHARERDGMLHHIEIESDRLHRIVEDLLALSRVEGGITVDGEPLLVQHIVAPVMASEAARWSEITFDADLPPELPVAMGERTYVEQVLRNLLSNAAKYSGPGTRVTVTAESTAGEVEIRVLDEGVGIDEQEADRLFGLYYRSSRTARKAAGAGIGLYVSRGLVTAMGGRIWARPRPEGGSEFGFSLPRADDGLEGLEDGAAEGEVHSLRQTAAASS